MSIPLPPRLLPTIDSACDCFARSAHPFSQSAEDISKRRRTCCAWRASRRSCQTRSHSYGVTIGKLLFLVSACLSLFIVSTSEHAIILSATRCEAHTHAYTAYCVLMVILKFQAPTYTTKGRLCTLHKHRSCTPRVPYTHPRQTAHLEAQVVRKSRKFKN